LVTLLTDTTDGDAEIKTPASTPPAVTLSNELLVPDVSPGEDAVKVYEVPIAPPKVQFVTFTTPATAVKFVQFATMPLPDAVNEMVAVESVTTLPWESSILTIGCVDINDPAVAPAATVFVNATCVAVPDCEGENRLLRALMVLPPTITDAVNWYAVPASPENRHVVTSTTPLFGVRPVQPVKEPDVDVKVIEPA
jgi:hypothetical protein